MRAICQLHPVAIQVLSRKWLIHLKLGAIHLAATQAALLWLDVFRLLSYFNSPQSCSFHAQLEFLSHHFEVMPENGFDNIPVARLDLQKLPDLLGAIEDAIGCCQVDDTPPLRS